MEEYRVRVRIFVGIILVLLGILGGRLVQLQLIEKAEYTGESRSNAVKEMRQLPARGAILDRNGEMIVSNEPTYTVTLTPRYFDPSKVRLLAELLEVPDSLVQQKIEEAKGWSAFRPSPVFREVTFDRLGRLLENLYRLPGVAYEVEQTRRYVGSARASHVLGYLREVNRDELDKMREGENERRYRQGDLVGKTGIEKLYEKELRGIPGSEFRLVNVHGLVVKSYRDGVEDVPPASGYNLYSTIDLRVQALAESLFVNKRGAAVALDPQTGGVIAFLSKPDYDPEIFTRSIDAETWNWLNNSPEKPLLNRATMNLMPPGSTWKPFMSLMSLQEGNIKPGERVVCRGGHPLGGGRFFKCMGVHGALDVVHAIQNSCNTFFFEMMYRTDVNTFQRYANMFGFGVEPDIGLDEAGAGLIPDSAYFDRIAPKGWGPGWTLSLGIGQGNMGVTPLQLARYMAAVANKGKMLPPHFVEKLVNPETGETFRPDLPPVEKIPIDEEYFDMVRQGMRLVMERGTGVRAQIPDIPSGGKTGTAQNPRGKDDSVFIMFAPWDDPQIAVAVQCENAGYGGNCAAPIASLMAELYLKGEIPDSPAKSVRLGRAMTARSDALPQRRPAAASAE